MRRFVIFVLQGLMGLFVWMSGGQAFAAEARPSFLSSSVQQHDSAANLPQWKRILESYDKEAETYGLCARSPDVCPSESVAAWQVFLRAVRSESRVGQIRNVNVWFNMLPYKQDNWIYGKDDHWASVGEFLEQSGDCEDFAIAKYLTLRQLGFPVDSMWVSIVYDVYSGTDHAFLIVEHDGETFVLDNRDDEVSGTRHSYRYQPHFLFNEKDVHIYESPVMARTIRKDDPTVLPGNR